MFMIYFCEYYIRSSSNTIPKICSIHSSSLGCIFYIFPRTYL